MLRTLAVRDVVLIDRLELEFGRGLSVLTGETGAGKSILLDALGLAIGARAEGRMVRAGAGRAQVTAVFDPAEGTAAELLRRHDLDADGPLILRRSLNRDGRSRAFVNDMPVAVGLLRRLGEELVEIHGQFEQRGLLDPGMHRSVLDAFAGHGELLCVSRAAWGGRSAAHAAFEEAETAAARDRADRERLENELEELAMLAPEEGEEEHLVAMRTRLMGRQKVADAINEACRRLGDRDGPVSGLRGSARALERAREHAAGLFDEALAALDRAAIEAEDAANVILGLAGRLEAEEVDPDTVEMRLFALRDASRKYGVPIDALGGFRKGVEGRLRDIRDGEGRLRRLAEAAAAADGAYGAAAARLAESRRRAGKALARRIGAELPALKLERAAFRVALEDGPPGPDGSDKVCFEVRTNASAQFGPMNRIASGGELARFALAIKVSLAGTRGPAMVFDEVDAGIGGATAAAVGMRLAALGGGGQVLVVTHAPQIAARADRHFGVRKGGGGTRVDLLDGPGREEEIARMLAGSEITPEARAAARALIGDDEA